MPVATYKISKDHNTYNNLIVYDRFYDGAFAGWRVTANDGYVFFDENEENFYLNPETMKEEPVTYYYKEILFSHLFDWGKFCLKVVPVSEVNEKHIF